MDNQIDSKSISDYRFDEWGLTRYLFNILITCQTPQEWGNSTLPASAAALYKLIDRGLLDGPEKGKIRSKPFSLSEKGQRVIDKIGRGVRNVDWLSRHKLHLLEYLEPGNPIQIAPAFTQTATSLERARYIQKDDSGPRPAWQITDLGREALADWREHQEWRKAWLKEDSQGSTNEEGSREMKPHSIEQANQ